MKIGISTATLFVDYKTEDAVRFLAENNVENAEVFLESFCEYNKTFAKKVAKNKGDININSVHVLTTQYEPQLYSINTRAQEDSFKILEGVMQAAKVLDAKYYTFHGTARFKKTPVSCDLDRIGKITQRIIDVCGKYGVTLAFENVHWCYYNYIGFFTEMKKRTVGLKGTLDIKQARQSEIPYKDFIGEMGRDIVTVHLSDVDKNGKMVLPGKGTTDFYDLFGRLKDVGFDGTMLIEAYRNDFKEYIELFESLEYIKEVADKVF